MSGALLAVDRWLGRVAMVRLVLILLVALAAAALLLSAIGVLQLPLGALAVSLAVAVGASWLGDRAMAALARADPLGSSALVTGLILFLVLYPTLDAAALLLTAAAALVANASKYLLRVGGRHVLNPAAAGLVAVGLTGQVGPAWWTATPVLDALVLVVAVLIAVRLRLVGPVAVLVLVGAALQLVLVVATGASTLGLALLLLLQSPLLFLAGVMFTEPITLPPRRGQRIVEALLVAVLLALPVVLPLQLLTLRLTPELALVLGNVFALLVARPAAAGMRLTGRRRLSPSAVEYAFTPDRRLPHRAGQYVELHLPHDRRDRRGVRRSLTVVSAPDEADGTLRVAVRQREPRSSFKRALDELPIGARARAVTVTGGFTLPADRRVPLVLLASGIGVTPFVSQLRQDAAEVAAGAPARDVLLVLRVPSASELLYREELAATGVRVLLVCPDPDALPPLPDQWHVVPALDADALAAVLPDPAGRTAYASGSPSFLRTARHVLARTGVRRVRTDAFSGY